MAEGPLNEAMVAEGAPSSSYVSFMIDRLLSERNSLRAQRDELLAALREVMRFRRGEGKYNFQRLPESERDLAYIEEWEGVENMISAAIAKCEAKP